MDLVGDEHEFDCLATSQLEATLWWYWVIIARVGFDVDIRLRGSFVLIFVRLIVGTLWVHNVIVARRVVLISIFDVVLERVSSSSIPSRHSSPGHAPVVSRSKAMEEGECGEERKFRVQRYKGC